MIVPIVIVCIGVLGSFLPGCAHVLGDFSNHPVELSFGGRGRRAAGPLSEHRIDVAQLCCQGSAMLRLMVWIMSAALLLHLLRVRLPDEVGGRVTGGCDAGKLGWLRW